MILDRNALSAWSEGLVAVEAFFRAANRLAVPNVVPVFVNCVIRAVTESGFAGTCR